MSTLTKVLIVLLTLFSLFACGAVLIHVGSANNYKAVADEKGAIVESLKAELSKKTRQYNESASLKKELEKKLNGRISRLEDEKNKLSVDLRKSERKSLTYQGRADSWAGVLASFEQTIGNLEQSLNLTQDQLDKTRSVSIQERKELNEITASLYEKVVQLDSLKASKRRLLEQKTSLEEQMTQIAGSGRIATPEPVTPDFDPVRSSSMPGELDIKGLITEVGKTLTVISVGSADGVRKGMVFHVTRGDDFICDIVITEVDTDQSAGVLDLVQQQPRTRDVVSTRL